MKKIGIKDFIEYNYPTGITTAPDGKHGVFVVVNVNEADNCYDSCLWVMDMENGEYRKLTNARKERKFIWLDNETVLFASNREKAYGEKIKNGEDWTCFYTINIYGGEAQFAFAVPYIVTKITDAGDKFVMCVAYDYMKPNFGLMDEEEKKEAMKAWKAEKDYEVFDESPFWANGQGIVNKKRIRLAFCDKKTNEVSIVSPDYESVEDFWVEGDEVLYVGNLYTDDRKFYNGLHKVSLSDAKRETLIPQADMRVDYACRLGGNIMVFASDMKPYGCNQNPFLYKIEDGALKLVAEYDRNTHNSICGDVKFADGASIVHDDKYIYFISTFRKQSGVCRFDSEGKYEVLIDRQGSVHTLDIKNGKLYYSAMRDLGLTELYCFDGNEEKKLTSFNDSLMAERCVCPVEEFTFTFKDVELDGYVMKPADFDPAKKYPGILTVHGGPRATFGPTYFHESQAFANAGYFVFFTNPVGSDGRGNAFGDLVGRYGTVDYDDLMAFTDEVLKRYPQLDENRLGMMGGSYGGFMANWIIGHTDRFAAVASQRSISNWISLSMTTDIGHTFDCEETNGDPWTNPERMWIQSPLKYADQAKTPTLFIQSDEDYRCWMGDAIQMFSALKFFGVETRMCLFHGENHELSRSGKPTHRVRRLKEMMEWFEKYLK